MHRLWQVAKETTEANPNGGMGALRGLTKLASNAQEVMATAYEELKRLSEGNQPHPDVIQVLKHPETSFELILLCWN